MKRLMIYTAIFSAAVCSLIGGSLQAEGPELELHPNAQCFVEGDTLIMNLRVINSGGPAKVNFAAMLEAYGMYFFYPEFGEELELIEVPLPAEFEATVELLRVNFNFELYGMDVVFHAAFLNEEATELYNEDCYDFSVIELYSNEESRTTVLDILYTNDIHSYLLPFNQGSMGGIARAASIISDRRMTNQSLGIETIVLDSGDVGEGTLFFEYDQWKSQLEIMDMMEYEAIQIGNHDFLFGVQPLWDSISAAFPPKLPGGPPEADNLRFFWGNVDSEDLSAEWVTPEIIDYFDSVFDRSRIFTKGCIQAGVVGLATTSSVYASSCSEEGLDFLDAYEYLGEEIDHLHNQGADAIIAISHMGYEPDLELAATAVGIESGRPLDIIVSAHSHTQLNHAEEVPNAGTMGNPNTYVVQAHSYGQFVGAVEIEVDPSADSVMLNDSYLIQVDDTVEEDADIAALVSEAKAGVDAIFGSPFETVLGDCEFLMPAQVNAESGLGNLITDSFMEASAQTGTPLDMCFYIEDQIRNDLFAGPVTEADVFNILSLHRTDHTGTERNSIMYLDIPGGEIYVRSAFFEPPFDFFMMSRTELVLEIILGIDDMDIVQTLFGGEIVGYPQWGGLTAVVDWEAVPLDRIDPANLMITGEVFDPEMDYRLGMNSSIVDQAFGYLNYLFQRDIDGDPETSDTEPVFNMPQDTGIEEWLALRDMIENLGTVTEGCTVIAGDRLRSVQPDLLIDGPEITFDPEPASPGQTVQINAVLRNIGDTGVDEATVEFYYDATPDDRTDDAHHHTGFHGDAWVKIGETVASVGPYPDYTEVVVNWETDAGLPSNEYRVFAVITDVISQDGEEKITGNNRGMTLSNTVEITDSF